MFNETSLLNAPFCVIGVDPGLSGAVCLLGKGDLVIRRDFKILPDIAYAIRELAPKADGAIMEQVHAMPGQGVCSMFSFGRSAGAAESALALSLPFHVPIRYVAPLRWQNFFRREFQFPDNQEFDSRLLASKIFPSFLPYFKRKKDHNSADAALIAAWGSLQSV